MPPAVESSFEPERGQDRKRAYEDPLIVPIRHFERARDHPLPKVRLEQVREAARSFREEMLRGPRVRFYKTCDLVRAPYPTKYGFRDAAPALVSPYMHVLNRLFIVQFEDPASGAVKTLLVSPSDVEGNSETPYFKRVGETFGRLLPLVKPVIAPTFGTVEQHLAAAGIAPEDVDYITYDHLHTQDLRGWLGSGPRPGYFPNAKLLVMREEWESLGQLLPIQADWYCPRGCEGIPEDRVVLLDHDVMLGGSVALLRTAGHTMGNHSIVVHTEDGLLVTSETGVSADSYSPAHSAIPGFRAFVDHTGAEVVMNGNTLESSVEQYISMIQEREVAGPCPWNRLFYNVVPSSEMAHFWLFPGISPTHFFGNLEFGKPVVQDLY